MSNQSKPNFIIKNKKKQEDQKEEFKSVERHPDDEPEKPKEDVIQKAITNKGIFGFFIHLCRLTVTNARELGASSTQINRAKSRKT